MNKIYFDFDGIILDSTGVICKMKSEEDGVFYNPALVKKWNMQDVIPNANNKMRTELFESDRFWELADDFIFDGAKELIEKYKKRAVICSIGGIVNQVKKLAFIKKHFGDIDCIPIITNMNVHPKNINKTYVNMGQGDIFIEDSASNLHESYAEYKFLFNNYGNFDAEWSESPMEGNFDGYPRNYNHLSIAIQQIDLFLQNDYKVEV
jgi:5'(3')-deoxyribonucleotidase